MDGVLVDSEDMHHDAEGHVFAHYGFKPNKEEWLSFKGRPDGEFFEFIHKNYLPDVSVDELRKKKNELLLAKIKAHTEVIPGSMDFVRSMNGTFKIALVTSSSKIQRDATLAAFDIMDQFDVLICADDVEHGKPDPEPYAKAIAQLGVDAASCVVIEDSINGMKSARAAGAQVIGITTSFAADVIEPYCDYTAEGYEEIREIIEKLSSD